MVAPDHDDELLVVLSPSGHALIPIPQRLTGDTIFYSQNLNVIEQRVDYNWIFIHLIVILDNCLV